MCHVAVYRPLLYLFHGEHGRLNSGIFLFQPCSLQFFNQFNYIFFSELPKRKNLAKTLEPYIAQLGSFDTNFRSCLYSECYIQRGVKTLHVSPRCV